VFEKSVVTAFGFCIAHGFLPAATLQKETLEAFYRYVDSAEETMQRELDNGGESFFWISKDPYKRARICAGEVLVQRFGNNKSFEVKGGIIHDWVGAGFFPGTLSDTLTLLQDYDGHKHVYPEVIDSKLRARQGPTILGYLRLLKTKVITVVLDMEHEVHYLQLDDQRWHSRCYSTRVREVRDAGKPGERKLPDGEGHGFLWRLYAYWRFEQKEEGVLAECRTITLTRRIPFGLGVIIRFFVETLPRESLVSTLNVTRQTVADRLETPLHPSGG
jgi:hypothetical protein